MPSPDVKPAADLNDLFSIRSRLMQQTNPLRAKIVMFSALYHPFDFQSDSDWVGVKTHDLGELLQRLYQTCSDIDMLETRLYGAAQQLEEIDSSLHAAEAIVQCLRSSYEDFSSTVDDNSMVSEISMIVEMDGTKDDDPMPMPAVVDSLEARERAEAIATGQATEASVNTANAPNIANTATNPVKYAQTTQAQPGKNAVKNATAQGERGATRQKAGRDRSHEAKPQATHSQTSQGQENNLDAEQNLIPQKVRIGNDPHVDPAATTLTAFNQGNILHELPPALNQAFNTDAIFQGDEEGDTALNLDEDDDNDHSQLFSEFGQPLTRSHPMSPSVGDGDATGDVEELPDDTPFETTSVETTQSETTQAEFQAKTQAEIQIVSTPFDGLESEAIAPEPRSPETRPSETPSVSHAAPSFSSTPSLTRSPSSESPSGVFAEPLSLTQLLIAQMGLREEIDGIVQRHNRHMTQVLATALHDLELELMQCLERSPLQQTNPEEALQWKGQAIATALRTLYDTLARMQQTLLSVPGVTRPLPDVLALPTVESSPLAARSEVQLEARSETVPAMPPAIPQSVISAPSPAQNSAPHPAPTPKVALDATPDASAKPAPEQGSTQTAQSSKALDRATIIMDYFNELLADREISVRAKQKDDCLHLIVEAERLPERQKLVKFIRKNLLQLHLPAMGVVKLHGRKSDQKKLEWSEEIHFDS